MKRMTAMMAVFLTLSMVCTTAANAHSGRLDANGGHNGSAKSKAKGLCTGYHYHRGGSDTSGSSTSTGTTSSKSASSKTTSGIINDSNYLPLRAVAELLHADVTWDSNTQSVTIVNKEISVVLQVGNNTAVIQGKPKEIQASPVLVDNKVYVPVRVISEALGYTVDYKSETNSVHIYTQSS